MIAAAVALAAYTLNVGFVFRELARPGQPREGRLLISVSTMIALSVVCGGLMMGVLP